jgi:hypothetical protein
MHVCSMQAVHEVAHRPGCAQGAGAQSCPVLLFGADPAQDADEAQGLSCAMLPIEFFVAMRRGSVVLCVAVGARMRTGAQSCAVLMFAADPTLLPAAAA